MTCDRVIIIDRGQAVASSSLAELAGLAGKEQVIVAEVDGPIDAAPVRALPGVDKVGSEPTPSGTRFRITAGAQQDIAPRVCALANECGWKLRQLRPEQQTLEELFVRLIGQEEPVA